MNRSGWLIFSSVALILAGVMRIIDAIWAFQYNGAIPYQLRDALFGHDLTTYGWLWLVAGVILIVAGVVVVGPGNGAGADVARIVGIIAASLGAISAVILMPYYPVWALLYVAIMVMVIYGLTAGYDQAMSN